MAAVAALVEAATWAAASAAATWAALAEPTSVTFVGAWAASAQPTSVASAQAEWRTAATSALALDGAVSLAATTASVARTIHITHTTIRTPATTERRPIGSRRTRGFRPHRLTWENWRKAERQLYRVSTTEHPDQVAAVHCRWKAN